MVRAVTIYNYDLTPERKEHYMNVIEELKKSDFKQTFYHINQKRYIVY